MENIGMVKAKLKAAFWHGCITLLVALLTGTLIYGIWYPGALAGMSQGTGLYSLIMIAEVVLGPLMSLVIYNTAKPRSELVRDYLIVGTIQISALLYGLYSVAVSRPVYMVFVKDRIEVVSAIELSKDDITEAKPTYQILPWFGPKLVCSESPTDPNEKSSLMFSALEGKDIQLLPKYYRACREGEIKAKTFSKPELATLTHITFAELPKHLQDIDFTWLPVVSRFGSWTAIYPSGSIEQVKYLEKDPFS